VDFFYKANHIKMFPLIHLELFTEEQLKVLLQNHQVTLE